MTMSRILSINLILITLVSFNTYASEKKSPESIDGTTRVSAEDIFDLYDKFENLVIIDSRKPSDRAGGYIEDSIALPDTDTTPATLAEHVATKATEVVFYCNGPKCGRSVKAAKIAVKDGYKNVYWFRGGWEEWSNNNYPFAKD